MTTVIFLPNWSYDPFIAPKQLFVALTAGLALGNYFFEEKTAGKSFKCRDRFSILLCIFILLMILNVIINNYAFTERIYGIRGRGTGFLSYLSLAIIAFSVARKKLLTSFFLYLVLANVFVCGYFLLQFLDLDIFSLETFYPAPSSTLGNPNFVSGFAGFSVFAILNYLDYKKIISRFLPCLILIFLNLFVMIKSQSIQGIIGFVLGCTLFLFLNILRYLRSFQKVGLYLTSISIGVITLFGFLGRGPLAQLIESSTVFSRLDYWRAAIRMTLDNWIFGVGLDGYGDFYRMYRDQLAVNRFGANQTADSAHNVFLDFFANGGIPLGILFLVISVYPAIKIVQNLRKSKEKEFVGILLLTIWSAFQLQAFVSVNQLGIAIWGWILLGAMVAHGNETDLVRIEHSKKPLPNSGLRIVNRILIVIIATLFAVPQLISEMKFLTFANRADGIALEKLVSSWPQDSRRIYLIAQGWKDSGDPIRSRDLVLKGISLNPNYYLNWSLLRSLPSATIEERENSLKEMQRLDPLVEPK
jgi:O-antigen ligase